MRERKEMEGGRGEGGREGKGNPKKAYFLGETNCKGCAHETNELTAQAVTSGSLPMLNSS